MDLRKIIEEKKTRLCFSADLTNKKELFNWIHKVGRNICLLKTHIDHLYALKYDNVNLKELGSFLDYYLRFHLEEMSKVKSLKILRKLVHG